MTTSPSARPQQIASCFEYQHVPTGRRLKLCHPNLALCQRMASASFGDPQDMRVIGDCHPVD